MKYNVKGNINLDGKVHNFEVNMDAKSESHLRDKVLAYFGSKYRIKRSAIEITEIKK